MEYLELWWIMITHHILDVPWRGGRPPVISGTLGGRCGAHRWGRGGAGLDRHFAALSGASFHGAGDWSKSWGPAASVFLSVPWYSELYIGWKMVESWWNLYLLHSKSMLMCTHTYIIYIYSCCVTVGSHTHTGYRFEEIYAHTQPYITVEWLTTAR
jgi:hypothetical protein